MICLYFIADQNDRHENYFYRCLSKCHQDLKISAYLNIASLLLEYAACIWDLHKEYYEIEKI